MPLKGIDISNYQPNVNMLELKAGGIDFVIIKASEGTNFRDPTWLQHVTDARAAGLTIFHYHFARPDMGNAAKAEADWFARCVNLPNGEGIMLDMEVGSGNLSGWLMTCADEMVAMTGAPTCVIYTGGWFVPGRLTDVALNKYPLCDANYNANSWTTFPNPPAPWTHVDFWQYTDKAAVTGSPTAVDGDYFRGTMDQLKLYTKGAQGGEPLTTEERRQLSVVLSWLVRGVGLGRVSSLDDVNGTAGRFETIPMDAALWEITGSQEANTTGGLFGWIDRVNAQLNNLASHVAATSQDPVVAVNVKKLQDEMAALAKAASGQ